MKKIIFILLVVMLLVGCSNSEETLRVGMDLRFYPFTGMDDSGEPTGIEVDIAYALGQYLGEEIEIVNTEFSMLIPALKTGDIDIIIGSMSITDEREQTVDFSKPYLYEKIVALLNKDYAESNNITSETSLDSFFSIEDAKFVGINGSIAVSIPESYDYEVEIVTTDAAAEREIVVGKSDALIGAYTLYGMHDTNKETTIMYKNPIMRFGTGMAVDEGNKELLDQVNLFIDQMASSGLHEELKTNWNQAVKEKLFDTTMTLDYYFNE